MSGTGTTFLYLIKHDLMKHKYTGDRNKWWIVYAVLGVTIGMTFFAFNVIQGLFKPQYLLYYTYSFPFVIFMIGFLNTTREWSNGTASWWLTLPYPRWMLVAAKVASSIVRTILMLCIAYVLTLLSALFAAVLKAEYGTEFVMQFLQYGWGWFGLFLLIAPFMTAFGILTAITTYSKWKPLVPLLWIGLPLFGNVFNWLAGIYSSSNEIYAENTDLVQVIKNIDLSGWLITILIGSVILAGGMLLLASRILRRDLSL